MMDSQSDDYGTIRHSLRIRFTIGDRDAVNQVTNTNPSDGISGDLVCQDVHHRHRYSSNGQNETSQSSSPIGDHRQDRRKKGKSFRYIEPQNHKSALFVNLRGNSPNSSDNQNQKLEKQLFISPDLNQATNIVSTSPPTPESTHDTSSYELIDWEEEKKSIEKDNESGLKARLYSSIEAISRIAEVVENNTMSHSCNFMNWMSASRRRASSVTPSAQSTSTDQSKSNASSDNLLSTNEKSTAQTSAPHQAGRRSSSSDELARLETPESNLLSSNRSASGNHLAITDSADTVCGLDKTQTNEGSSIHSRQVLTSPLQIEISSPDISSIVSPISATSHPVSLDDILKIDMDDARFEEECRALENEAKYWEDKVEKLERQQFADDVPRTLVDSIIKHRKELRELEYELYKRTLDSEESDAMSCKGKLSQNTNRLGDTSPSDILSQIGNKYMDAQDYYENDVDCVSNQLVEDMDGSLYVSSRRSSRFGSHLKPGQENTVDVLSAVPPPSSLQRRHYLNKASSGTDTSEYSQMPSYKQHSHKIVRHHKIDYHPQDEEQFMDDSPEHPGHQNHHRQRQHNRVSRRHVQQQHRHHNQQLYVSLNKFEVDDRPHRSPNHRPCASPIRPDHFKSDFRSPQLATAHHSSSTASSSSPQ